ncbi:relaxase/mobilization nuclease domain-containing protein [Nocardia gipuzkoensis]
MIPKIKRGQKMGGLMVYLLGEGDHNEHRDRHIIAGSPTVMRAQWLGHFDGPGDKEAAREVALAVAHEMEIPRALYGTQVRMKAKAVAVGVGARELGMDVVEPAGKGEKAEYRDAPVWHCVLSLMPGEELDDAKWHQVVNEFMDRMGFTGTPDGKRAQARWAAVRHGHSGEHGEGQDHIHIAASLVREDGSKVSTFDYGPGKAKGDWKRAQQVAGELEREFGLKVLASRQEGGGLSGNSRAEIERAREGTGETERERLRRAVRAVAVAAEDETAFVRGLREAGISTRPRYETGGTGEVTGYSVRFQRNGGEVGPWVGGGKLAGDLSLTALREQQWDDSPDGRDAALTAWKNHTERTNRTGRSGPTRSGGVDAWKRAAAETEQWRERLGQVPHGDRAQWAWMAGQAAGVFAAWSETLEGNQPGAFAAAAHELTRSAQLNRRRDRYRPPRGAHSNAFADLAQLLLAHPTGSRPRSHTRGATREVEAVAAIAVVLLALMLLLLAIAIAIAVEIARAHRARGELGRALAVEHMTRQHLDPVRAQWETELNACRDQWDRDAADVFAAAAGRAAARTIDRATAPETDAAAAHRDSHGQDQREKDALTAASGPLTPPTEPTAEGKRRPYYTELSRDARTALRVAAVAGRGFADRDIKPRRWTDELLDEELTHLRTEVGLLTEEIAQLRAGNGPNTRQVRADNADLTRKAEKIPAAQQAQKTAEDTAGQVKQLTEQRTRLEQELEATPWIKMRARTKLQAEIAATSEELEEITPTLPTVRAAAKAAAEATGIPADEWNEVLFEADERCQRRRLREAQDQDQRDLSDDTTYLGHLHHDLEKMETEHARRERLTPEQRASEARTQTSDRTTRPSLSHGTGPTPQTPYRAQDLGRDTGQGLGM